MAAGDIMTHSMIVRHAQQRDGSYDFNPYFADVAPLFSQADFVLGNLETRMAGKERGWHFYPTFNAPDSLAPAIAKAGFTLLSTANNHCMDMGAKGLIRTNQLLAQNGLLQTGTNSSAEEAERIQILEKNGVRLAVLAYTEHTNGIPVPKAKPWMVNRLNLEVMRRDIDRARQQGADFVAMFLHFGVEYSRRPSEAQKKLVMELFEHGADLVLGSHPHVAQPAQTLRMNGQDKAVIYSMGNFLANQLKKYTYLGAVLSVNLCVEPDGTKRLLDVEAIPTKTVKVVLDGHLSFRILPIQQVLAQGEGSRLSKNELLQMERDLMEMNEFFTSM